MTIFLRNWGAGALLLLTLFSFCCLCCWLEPLSSAIHDCCNYSSIYVSFKGDDLGNNSSKIRNHYFEQWASKQDFLITKVHLYYLYKVFSSCSIGRRWQGAYLKHLEAVTINKRFTTSTANVSTQIGSVEVLLVLLVTQNTPAIFMRGIHAKWARMNRTKMCESPPPSNAQWLGWKFGAKTENVKLTHLFAMNWMNIF